MKVKVEMVIETEDFGDVEFKKEMEKLIAGIDDKSKLVSFQMFKVDEPEL